MAAPSSAMSVVQHGNVAWKWACRGLRRDAQVGARGYLRTSASVRGQIAERPKAIADHRFSVLSEELNGIASVGALPEGAPSVATISRHHAADTSSAPSDRAVSRRDLYEPIIG